MWNGEVMYIKQSDGSFLSPFEEELAKECAGAFERNFKNDMVKSGVMDNKNEKVWLIRKQTYSLR